MCFAPLVTLAEEVPSLHQLGSQLHESINIGKIPVIYLVLSLLGVASVIIWLYNLLTLNLSEMMPESFVQEIRRILIQKRYEKALLRLNNNESFAANIISKGIEVRKKGPQYMIEAVQSEGQRCQNTLLEKLKLLRDISKAAPFIGVFGTLLSFYFSSDQIFTSNEATQPLAVTFSLCLGPTVLGIIISVFSSIFYTTLRSKIIFILNAIVSEILTLIRTVDIDYL